MRGIYLFVFILFSCSTFDVLEPNPKLSSAENGYTKLKNDGESFELSKGSKYVVHFPQPTADKFALVLTVKASSDLHYYFTDQFDDGEKLGKIYSDEAASDTLAVYAIGTSAKTYYWAIDNVKKDLRLHMTYRYVPMWRLRFENSFAELEQIANATYLNDDTYSAWGEGKLSLATITTQAAENEKRILTLSDVQGQLSEISSVMPTGLSEADPAVQAIRSLKAELTSGLAAAKKHKKILTAYTTLFNSERFPSEFAKGAANVAAVFSEAELPPKVRADIESKTSEALQRTAGYIQAEIDKKRDLSPIAIDSKSLKELNNSVNSAARPRLQTLLAFVENFNTLAPTYSEKSSAYKQILDRPLPAGQWPTENYYASKQAELATLASSVNQMNTSALNSQNRSSVVATLKRNISRLQANVSKSASDHRIAKNVATEIGRLKTSNKYGEMIRVVKQNASISFLKQHYAFLDRLSASAQENAISGQISQGKFGGAEQSLRQFNSDDNFLNLSAIKSFKTLTASSLEGQLFQAVFSATRKKTDSVLVNHAGDYRNVVARYEGADFKPAYTLTFSAKGAIFVDDRNDQIATYLKKRREVDFPETAIAAVYKTLIANTSTDGVLKARAIVEHGNRYTGKKSSIWNMVNEADPHRGKRLSKAGTYRRVMAMPVNATSSSENEYMFKVNMVIPSEAKFPAFEVNIKLPETVAASAANAKWFDEIKLNGKEIRPEGRISITAPTAANNFEFQISPIQIRKGENNSFEVRFKHKDFKIFNISIMAQKPLIRKH